MNQVLQTSSTHQLTCKDHEVSEEHEGIAKFKVIIAKLKFSQKIKLESHGFVERIT